MIRYDEELDTYDVPSDTVNIIYEVFFNRTGNLQIKNRWICSCKGFCLSYQYSGACKHIRLVNYYIHRLKNDGVSFIISKQTGKIIDRIQNH